MISGMALLAAGVAAVSQPSSAAVLEVGLEVDRCLSVSNSEVLRVTALELDATEQMVAALYASMSDAPLFKRLSLLYFAAASFSEAARRLGRPELAPGFLLHAHPGFGPELRACAAQAVASPRGRDRDALLDRIGRAIEPFDTAGLLDRTRRDWYPVLSDDLLGAAAKLDSTVEEIRGLLERCGFESSATANS